MTLPRIYLDHAATSPLRPEARDAMERCWGSGPGNAASAHAEGRAAAATLADARARVAALVGARPEDVIFTSGATEASNLAVRGPARALASRGRHVVSTRIEHAATRRACETLAVEGWRVSLLAPDAYGRIDPADLARAITPDTSLISVIAGQNEIGTLPPLERIAELAHRAGALLHLDAVQAVGVIDFSDLRWDLLSVSAHKLGGPQGIGALIARAGSALAPVLVGGAQERGLRPGTVPVALAAGFGAAAESVAAHRRDEHARLASMHDRLARALLGLRPDLVPLGAWPLRRDEALPHLLAFGVDGARGDELVHALDGAGVAASSASACLGDARSHVLEAVGIPDRMGMIRLSLGWTTREDEVDEAPGRIAGALDRLMKLPPFERRRLPLAARAAAAGVRLTSLHWQIAEAVFSYHMREGVLPGTRYLARTLEAGQRVDDLFPDGLSTLASWLGLPVPQGGCRPAGV